MSHATKTLERTGHAAPLAVVVEVVNAQAQPAQLRIQQGAAVLGSSPDCDLVIDDPTVSRRHARISLVPEGVQVEDLGSYNGVFYLGHRIDTMVLAFGGHIELGSATLSLRIDVEELAGELPPYPHDFYRAIVGRSQQMRQLFAKLTRLEGSLVTVLIEGESGAGKELVAHALHHGSRVADGPFVVLNCGALQPELVASELFGHTSGAFTGATSTRDGAFLTAHGGTLFLDEIGELPLSVQPMLLRALEMGEVRPVGSDAVRRVKVRVVAATNRDLETEVAEGRFRKDLYYRFAVVRLRIAALSARPDDIVVLTKHFADMAGIVVSPEVMQRLQLHSWPGNVRELKNVVEAYAALGSLPPAVSGAADQTDDLRRYVDLTRPFTDQKDALVERFTTHYLEALMLAAKGDRGRAAELAGLTRPYLNRMIARYLKKE